MYFFLKSFLSRSANEILSATVSESNNAEYWKTIAISPSEVKISPLSNGISPQISFKTVLLPEPENPTIARTSPSATLKDISLMTVLSSNFLIRFLTSILII